MPNSEPIQEYAYGSRQKRMENFTALVEFLEKWKASVGNVKNTNAKNLDNASQVAERFCNVNFQYGYVSRNDICQQALMKVNLL